MDRQEIFSVYLCVAVATRSVLVIGGTAQDFLGEYIAGGIIILLGLDLGTGMHGGTMYIRGEIQSDQPSRQVEEKQIEDQDYHLLYNYVSQYSDHFRDRKHQ
jgi:glutamate synthase domain-containing protein 3